jgi:hypothetical protein
VVIGGEWAGDDVDVRGWLGVAGRVGARAGDRGGRVVGAAVGRDRKADGAARRVGPREGRVDQVVVPTSVVGGAGDDRAGAEAGRSA